MREEKEEEEKEKEGEKKIRIQNAAGARACWDAMEGEWVVEWREGKTGGLDYEDREYKVSQNAEKERIYTIEEKTAT